MAKPLFLGRERELQLYQDFLNADVSWLLVVTGPGGCGKSALLRHLKDQMPPGIPVVRLDFAGEAQRHKPLTGEQLPIDALTRLSEFASQIRDFCELQKYREFSEELTKARKQLLAQRVPTYIGNLTQDVRAEQGSVITGNRVVMDTSEDPMIQDIRREARSIVSEAFGALLDTFVPDRLVVMLDTCEWLQEAVNAEVGLWMVQDLLLSLHDMLQRRHKKCHVIMTSTVRLQLKAIAEQDQEQLSLAPLDKMVVEQHLDTMKIQDVELRQHLYEMTQGYASCVSILCELWRELTDEEKPSAVGELSAFKRLFYERAVNKFIDEHILDARLKSPFDKLTRYGVLLRRFNLRLLKMVFPEIFGESEDQARVCFNQFINYPYVKHLGQYNYVLLELLRAALAESIRINEPDAWERYHKRALDFLASLPKTSLTKGATSDWYYHNIAYKIAYDDEPGMLYWREALQELETLGTGLDTLLEAARDETLMFTAVALAAQQYQQQKKSS